MPTNISFASATVISTFPYDFTQTDINQVGINLTVFYKFTAPVGAVVISGWCFSGNVGSGYRPTTYVYEGPSHTDVPVYDQINAPNKPFLVPVTPGTDYYFEIRKNIDDLVVDNHVRVQFEIAVNGTPTDGDFLVNDDTPGFPLTVLSHTTDYQVVRFYNGVAAGEDGDILTSGISAFDDFNTREVRLYTPSFSLIGIADYSSGTAHIRACRPLNKFYVAFEVNPVTVRTVNPDASYGGTTWTLTGMNGCLGFAPSNDGSKFYITQHAAAVPIKVWDVASTSFVTDLYAGATGITITDILVLSDDTIVAIFESTSPGTIGLVTIRHFNAAGTVLHTYNPGTNSRPGGTFARLAASLTDPTSFWLWMHESGGISKIREIQVSDGTVLTTRTFLEYETGIMVANETATPTTRYGPSFSCVFVVLRNAPAPPEVPSEDVRVTQAVVEVLSKTFDKGGIIFLNPPKTDKVDTYYGPTPEADGTSGKTDVKIPDPTIKTGLIGE